MNREELREEITHVLRVNADRFVSDAADALLAGPVGELLDENRLQSLILRRQERTIEGLERVDVVGLQSERDQLRATLDAVRELADGYAKDDADSLNLYGQNHPIAYHPARELRRILDGADGGER